MISDRGILQALETLISLEMRTMTRSVERDKVRRDRKILLSR